MMTSHKRWVQMGQGAFLKWETAGQELEGHWGGTSDGKFGPLGALDTSSGRVTFPLHTALLDLKGVRIGAEVKIMYVGKQMSKGGREFKAFQVFLASADDMAATPPEDDSVPF